MTENVLNMLHGWCFTY